MKAFLDTHGASYASVTYDDSSIDASMTTHHEWNGKRFSVLGSIRQASVDYARALNADYFVADCDNFIVPHTLSEMVALRHLGVVAPMLDTNTLYSNFHVDVDAQGYFAHHELYTTLRFRGCSGCINVKVVHCTYFLAHTVLQHVHYLDETSRHEYVIFSDWLRRAGVPQYLDNRFIHGHLTFATTREEFLAERVPNAPAGCADFESVFRAMYGCK